MLIFYDYTRDYILPWIILLAAGDDVIVVIFAGLRPRIRESNVDLRRRAKISDAATTIVTTVTRFRR